MSLFTIFNLSIFIALIFGGEAALIPVVYLVFTDVLELMDFFIMLVAAMLISDTLWYTLGRYLTRDRLFRLPFVGKKKRSINKFSKFFETRGIKIAFLAKFVYGTRLITQVLCGMHKVSYWKFMLVGLFGTLLWAGALLTLVSFVNVSLTVLKGFAYRLQVGFLIFLVFVVLLNLLVKRAVAKKWFNRL